MEFYIETSKHDFSFKLYGNSIATTALIVLYVHTTVHTESLFLFETNIQYKSNNIQQHSVVKIYIHNKLTHFILGVFAHEISIFISLEDFVEDFINCESCPRIHQTF